MADCVWKIQFNTLKFQSSLLNELSLRRKSYGSIIVRSCICFLREGLWQFSRVRVKKKTLEVTLDGKHSSIHEVSEFLGWNKLLITTGYWSLFDPRIHCSTAGLLLQPLVIRLSSSIRVILEQIKLDDNKNNIVIWLRNF